MRRVLLAALRHVRWCPIALVSLLAPLAPASMAQPIDPHALFEQKCGRCHDGHAGDFARKSLLFENGELVSQKSRKRILDFLPRHFGKLSADEVGALVDAFERQVQTDGLYQEKCRICHEPARALARRELALKHDQLVGRYTGADIKRLLSYHGRLSDQEQTIIYDMLVWQLATAEGQALD